MKIQFFTIIQCLNSNLVSFDNSFQFSLHQTISGFSFHTKELQKNSVFICLNGKNTKGVKYAHIAYQKGVRSFMVEKKDLGEIKRILRRKPCAVFVVSNVIKAYGQIAAKYLQQFFGTKIAITGSVGKTSLKEILSSCLELQYKVFKSQGNFNNHLGVPYNIFRIQQSYDFYVFELGMNHAGEINYLSSMLSPDVTIINSIQSVHIGNFKNLKEIAKAKSEIFLGQKKGSLVFLPQKINEKKTILQNVSPVTNVKLNQNDLVVHFLKEDDITINYEITEGFKLKYLFYDTISQSSRDGIVKTGINFFAENYSFAFAVAEFFGLKRKDLVNNLFLDTLDKTTPHRMQLVNQNPMLIDDSYNANIYTTIKTIEKLMQLKNDYPLNIVLGDTLELGKATKSLYLDLVKSINRFLEKVNNKNNIAFYFLKPLRSPMEIIFNNLNTQNKKYFLNKNILCESLGKKIVLNSISYFKASRGIGLDQIVSSLLQRMKKNKGVN